MTWQQNQFARRTYAIDGPQLDAARRIELIVKIDGKVLVQMQAREPGLLAFVSRPDDQGFAIEVVEVAAGKFVDQSALGDDPADVLPWQVEALGLMP